MAKNRTGRVPAAIHTTTGSTTTGALGEDEIEWIGRALKQAGIEPSPELVERLTNSVRKSMALFRQASAAQITYRERHDALRALLQLTNETDPSVGVIRKRIKELAAVTIDELEERARRLWPRVFRGESLEGGFDFVTWSQTAPGEKLLEAVRTFASDGGKIVPGRMRPGGKRSRSRSEERILGQIRGAASPTRGKTAPPLGSPENQPSLPGNGRPRADAADELVMHLVWDWADATGTVPTPGRSERTGFGGLVHHVFSWLDIEAPEQSLRRHWDVVASAVVTPIEGGEEWR
jgi:hypothetical protein